MSTAPAPAPISPPGRLSRARQLGLAIPSAVLLAEILLACFLPPRSPWVPVVAIGAGATVFVGFITSVLAILQLIRDPASRSWRSVVFTVLGSVPAMLFVGLFVLYLRSDR